MFSIYIVILYALLVMARPTRKIAIALTPWLLFACCYDAMRLYPNYEVNAIDVRGLYDAEKHLFGIASGTSVLIPSEFFALHHCPAVDLLAGFFYLCWVPLPLGFALYLYLKGQYKNYIRFSLVFLFVNLLGFCGYYIHPAAPPWYVMNYGFEPLLHTPGNVAGLTRFDELTGIPVFHTIYGGNSNVFAAIPSLHAAYMLITTVYAVIGRQRWQTVCVFTLVCMGIWFTAVYTGHHYVIDVLLGIAVAIVGIFVSEKFIFRLPAVKHGLERYVRFISPS